MDFSPTSEHGHCVTPDLDSLEYSLDLDLPEFQRGPDLQSIVDISYVGQFLIGLGILMQVFAKFVQTVSYDADSGIQSLLVNCFGMTVYVFGFIYFGDY